VEAYLDKTRTVFAEIGAHLDAGTLEAALKGPVAHDGFKRLT